MDDFARQRQGTVGHSGLHVWFRNRSSAHVSRRLTLAAAAGYDDFVCMASPLHSRRRATKHVLVVASVPFSAEAMPE